MTLTNVKKPKRYLIARHKDLSKSMQTAYNIHTGYFTLKMVSNLFNEFKFTKFPLIKLLL